LRPLKESEALSLLWRENVSDLQLISYSADDTLRAAQVTNELIKRIRHSRRDGVPLEWIAFLGIEAVATNFASFREDPSFWPTLLTLAASEEITTAFVVNEPVHPFVTEYRKDMDYVLRFAAQGSGRTVHIDKSPDLRLGGDHGLQFSLQQGRVEYRTQVSDPPARVVAAEPELG
jgi:hypothetical protein